MKLVYDADKVVSLGLPGLNNVAVMARTFADDIEAGEWGNITRAIVLVENDDGIVTLGWGEGCTAYEMMGMFEAAKLKVFAEDFCGE